MGITYFRTWIFNRYPMILRKISSPTVPHVHNLFIDFGTLQYQAIRAARVPETYSQPDVITTTLLFLEDLIQTVKPRNLISICDDGIIGLAKLHETCKRHKVSPYASPTDKLVNHNSVCNGTEFSENLTVRLKEFISQRKKYWTAPVVICDFNHTPGEAEHKIFQFLSSQKEVNSTTFIFTPDSDLILLSLHCRISNLYLIYEINNNYEVVSVDLLKELLQIDLCSKILEDPEPFFTDFCLMVSFFGTDYFPCVSQISIQNHSLDNFLSIYKEQFGQEDEFLTNGDTFDFPNFRRFLELASPQPRPKTVVDGVPMLEGFIWFMRLLKTFDPSRGWIYSIEESPSLFDLYDALNEQEFTFLQIEPINTYLYNLLTIQVGQERNLPQCFCEYPSLIENKGFIKYDDFIEATKYFDEHKSELTSVDLDRSRVEPPLIYFKDEPEFLDNSYQIPEYESSFITPTISKLFYDFEIQENTAKIDIAGFSEVFDQNVVAGYPYPVVGQIVPKITLSPIAIQGIKYNSESEVFVKLFHNENVVCFPSNSCALYTQPAPSFPSVSSVPLKQDVAVIRSGEFAGAFVNVSRGLCTGVFRKHSFLNSTFHQSLDNYISLKQLSQILQLPSDVVFAFLGPLHTSHFQKSIGLKLVKRKNGIPGYVSFFQRDYQFSQQCCVVAKSYVEMMSHYFPEFKKVQTEKDLISMVDSFIKTISSSEFESILKQILGWLHKNSPGHKYKTLSLHYHFPTISFFNEANHLFGKGPPVQIKTLISEKNLFYPKDFSPNQKAKGILAKDVVYIASDNLVPFGTRGFVFGVLGDLCYVVAFDDVPYGTTFFGLFSLKRVFHTDSSHLFVVDHRTKNK